MVRTMEFSLAPEAALVIEPGMRPGPNGGDPVSVGVPFGSPARLILLYLQSEALRTRVGYKLRYVAVPPGWRSALNTESIGF
jgi:hypothetical protein